MQTLDNVVLTNQWQLVTSSASTIQVIGGGAIIAYGDEPTKIKGHIISFDEDYDSAIENTRPAETWVILPKNTDYGVIAITEY